MAKTGEARKVKLKAGEPTEPEIRAVMGKAIREVKRRATLQNVKLAVAGKRAWAVPK